MNPTPHTVMEMVIIRLSPNVADDTVREIFKQALEWAKASEFAFSSMALCKSDQVENDWAVYLLRPSQEGETKALKTQALSAMFRSVGMVHHTVWKLFEAIE